MVTEISSNDSINYRVPATSFEGKLNQGRVILRTVRGSCPLNRRLGLNADLVDKPTTVIQRGIYTEIKSQFEEYAPDLTLIDVNVTPLENGLKIKCSVEVNM